MYPGTDHPSHTDECESFEDFRETVESCSEDLNQVISWSYFEDRWWKEGDEEPKEPDSFEVLLFLPRKSRTYEVVWTDAQPTDELKLWIEQYLRPRIARYFQVGWKGGGEE